MKLHSSLALLVALLVAQAASAQDPGAAEQAQKMALKLQAALGPLADAQVAVDADASKAASYAHGVLLVPDKRATDAALAAPAAGVSALGQLWCHQVSPVVDGRPVASDRTRIVTLNEEGKPAAVQLFLLGLGKTASGGAELLVFGKEAQPLLRVPFEKLDTAPSDKPCELSGRKVGEATGALTITMFGHCKAEFEMMKAD